MAEEPSSEPTAKNDSLGEELAKNRGILRSSCGRREQLDTGEGCGVESVSQSPLKNKAFLISPEQNPPFYLRPKTRVSPPTLSWK